MIRQEPSWHITPQSPVPYIDSTSSIPITLSLQKSPESLLSLLLTQSPHPCSSKRQEQIPMIAYAPSHIYISPRTHACLSNQSKAVKLKKEKKNVPNRLTIPP